MTEHEIISNIRQGKTGVVPVTVPVGTRFGDWTVVGETHRRLSKKTGNFCRMIVCRCACGVVRAVFLFGLRAGKSNGCGCKRHVAKRRGLTREQLEADRSYRYKYGITAQDKDRMYQQQEGKCLICERWHEKLAVDHCHKTGIVRGLLCDACNFGLGLMKDDPVVLARAIAYLQAKT